MKKTDFQYALLSHNLVAWAFLYFLAVAHVDNFVVF